MTKAPGLIALTVLVVALAFVAACRRDAPSTNRIDSKPAAWFEDIAESAGINFVHRSGHQTRHYLPEIMGGGVALLDFDNDGWLDVYFVQSGNLLNPAGGSGNRLYRNRGNGTFADVTDGSGAGIHEAWR